MTIEHSHGLLRSSQTVAVYVKKFDYEARISPTKIHDVIPPPDAFHDHEASPLLRNDYRFLLTVTADEVRNSNCADFNPDSEWLVDLNLTQLLIIKPSGGHVPIGPGNAFDPGHPFKS